ncbi:MAG: hypothetical protein MUD11_11940 [Rhodobacteraceae bacterium]|nr:hypothetical protein [Paracoccaceae bacterium]
MPARADALLAAAGLAVGDYILAHRIPPLAQRVLRLLPAALSARLLARAIARHAWTFAGSLLPGACDHPACHWHAAVFARLYQRLVWPDAAVTETHCAARGDATCRFVIVPGRKAAIRDNAPLA